MEFSGHKILVTGGSSGIGLEFARQLLARKNRIAILRIAPGIGARILRNS
jgi:short-subunit dehydrogenase involved in D-alanine esterification of teichoic acids